MNATIYKISGVVSLLSCFVIFHSLGMRDGLRLLAFVASIVTIVVALRTLGVYAYRDIPYTMTAVTIVLTILMVLI